MAEKPIKTPLPADLPEDWNAGQIVAPDGTTVGLTEQHGYNYLMKAVNRAQSGVNAVNEAFETVSGKRTCRFVVGTSTAGWTEADCDFLCDGVDDQVEIQQAVNELPEDGGAIILLDGMYQLSAEVSVSGASGSVILTGNSGSSVINGRGINISGNGAAFKCCISGFSFAAAWIISSKASLSIKNCVFRNSGISFSTNGSEGGYAFLCEGNVFSGRGATSIAAFIDTEKSFCNISNNIFDAEYTPGSSPALISAGEYVFSGNNVRCTGERAQIHPYDHGMVMENLFYNCDFMDSRGSVIIGNFFFDCNIISENDLPPESCSVVSGNNIQDGTIHVSGNVSVTGNSVIIHESSGVENAIYSKKSVNNAYADRAPLIVGNYIVGGTRGIFLDDPLADYTNKACANALINSNRIYGSQTPIKIGQYWSNCMVTDNLFTTGAIEDNGTNNIVRFNSDDTSGGGSTPATVQQATPTVSVNEDGSVTATATQAAGYVAAGTRSATHQLSSADDADLTPENIKDGVSIFGVQGTLQSEGGGTAGVSSFNGRSGAVAPGSDDYTASMVGAIPAESVKTVQVLTEAEYTALTNKSATTLYLIKE